MSVDITKEDVQRILDWAIIFGLGSVLLIFVALVLGIAVRLFFVVAGL